MNSINGPNQAADINQIVQGLKASGDEFAVATVVRTVSVTAAKPGAKAIIDASGAVLEGWVGGGCARHAVIKAAQAAIADGEPRLVTLQPEEILHEQGLCAGQEADGVLVASNMCPSKGSMEIFVEPFLSNPELLVIGASPVAQMLARMAPLFDFSVSVVGDALKDSAEHAIKYRFKDYSEIPLEHSHRYVVVATQGSGDVDALIAAIQLGSKHLAFVGSKRKLSFLSDKLIAAGQQTARIDNIKGPAGLDIGAVTPQEIALSILAELVQVRRRKKQQA